MLENLAMLVFASSFYTRIVLPLSETLVVIVIEIIENFTIDCGAIIGSACWNTSWVRHSWDNEAEYSHHLYHARSLASVGLDRCNCEMLLNLSFIKCENPASYVAI